jgi:hypothetical protein
MSRRKPLAAVAAVTAALAVAVPEASASAATPAPAVRTVHAVRIAHIGFRGVLLPGSLPCQILINQIRFAVFTGNALWANALSNVFIYSGCGGAAI